VFRADLRRAGEALLDGGKNLNPLDGIYSQVGIHPHGEVEHLHRVAGLLAHHRQQGGGNIDTRSGRSSSSNGRRCRNRGAGAKEGGDLTQGLQGAQVFGTDLRRTGEAFLDGGEDLHPLDGIDPQVGIHPHGEVEHLHRVAGLLAHHRQQGGGNIDTRSNRSSNNDGRCRSRQAGAKEGGDLAQSLQGAEMFGTDERCAGEAFLDGGEDLHPFDGVDSQVGVQPHVQVEHLFRITGLLADYGEQGGGDIDTRGNRSGCSNGSNYRSR